MRNTVKKLHCLIVMLLLPAGIAALLPCDVYMETARAQGDANKVQVRLFVELVHKRCPLNIKKTVLAASGLSIERQGGWKKVGSGIYRKELTVSLAGKAKGEIRVLRECPKTGRQEEVLGIVRI